MSFHLKFKLIQRIEAHLRMIRLSFGIKTVLLAEFDGIVDQISWEISKTEAYLDDIVVQGESLAGCTADLKSALRCYIAKEV